MFAERPRVVLGIVYSSGEHRGRWIPFPSTGPFSSILACGDVQVQSYLFFFPSSSQEGQWGSRQRKADSGSNLVAEEISPPKLTLGGKAKKKRIVENAEMEDDQLGTFLRS